MALFDERAFVSQRFGVGDSLLAVSMRCVAVLGACCGATIARAVDVPLTDSTVVRFADVREGVEALTRRDDYIRQLSAFDRQVRLHTNRPVSEEAFLASVATHVRPWEAEDIRKLTPLLQELAGKIESWKLPLPKVILLVKTDGQEESGAAYCRGSAIVLPQNMVQGDNLRKILPHELFHVLSNQNPALREALYETIGFRACNEVALGEPLASRKITNPDAPVNNHFMTAMLNGRSVELMPVLISKFEGYDPARGDNLFGYLDFKLLLLDRDGEVRRPALVDGRQVLLEPDSVPAFAEQVGRNTKYVIHPEEILADNFVLLLNGRIDVPTPRIIEQMGKVLQQTATAR